jgi:type IV secretory pathway VirB4 component
MKNEFTPAPGWLAEDVTRAKRIMAGKRDTYPEFGWWGGLSEIQVMETVLHREHGMNATEARDAAINIERAMEEAFGDAKQTLREQKAVIEAHINDMVVIAHTADAAETADASEVCAAIRELRQQRDAARFEASRARGEARLNELAMREIRKKRRDECRALGRIMNIACSALGYTPVKDKG